MNKSIEMPINISDKDIERLEKVKQLLQDIKEIDNSFKLSNVIEANENTILIFNCASLCHYQELRDMEVMLTNKLQHKCIILDSRLSLDKAIGIDNAEGRDYTTVTYYNEKGNPIKEETTQYK